MDAFKIFEKGYKQKHCPRYFEICMDAFLWLKMRFSFSVNVYVFIPMVLFYC